MVAGMKWDDYFMGLAHAAAAKSKDPSTQVGAVIVDSERRIVSVGFNGPPRGTDDDHAYSNREFKLLRVLHAEENAILFAGRSLRDCCIYVTHHPCAHCAAVIVQAGIRNVFHPPTNASFVNRWYDNINHAQAMFREAGVSRTVLYL